MKLKHGRFCALATLLALQSVASIHANAQTVDYFIDPRFGAYGYSLGGSLSGFKSQLQSDGLTVQSVTSLDSASLAGSNALYIELNSASASSYPLTNGELGVITSYVQSGHSVIFQLENGSWRLSDNDLFTRLGLGANQIALTNSPPTTLPNPAHPILNGPFGTVSSGFTYSNAVGNVNVLGSLTSLVNSTDGNSVLPFLERGSLGAGSGGIFFLMDVNNLQSPSSASLNSLQQNLFYYAATTPTGSAVPEPGSLALFAGMIVTGGVFGASKLRRGKKTVR